MDNDETNREYDPVRKRSIDCSDQKARPEDDAEIINDHVGCGANYDDERVQAPIEIRELETTETVGGQLVITTDLEDETAPAVIGNGIDLGRVC